jgi:Fungal ubiquitin-associated domain
MTKAGSSTLSFPHSLLCTYLLMADPISLHGLSKETVDRYVSMGFTKELVIEKMRKLNIRNLTTQEIEGENGQKLLEELLSSG